MQQVLQRLGRAGFELDAQDGARLASHQLLLDRLQEVRRRGFVQLQVAAPRQPERVRRRDASPRIQEVEVRPDQILRRDAAAVGRDRDESRQVRGHLRDGVVQGCPRPVAQRDQQCETAVAH